MIRNRKITPRFCSIVSFFTVLLVWSLLVEIGGFSETVFPGPFKVARSMWELAVSGVLLKHTAASLFRVTAGFYLAVVLAAPLGIMLGRSAILRCFVSPVIQFLRPISPLAWIPLSMLWFGIGDKPAVFLIFLSSFFPLVVSTTVAVAEINPVFFYVAANFNFSKAERITKIIVPAIMPTVVTALRISLGIAWLVVVAAEMIAVKSGLGYLILDSRNALRMDYVMVAMIAIGAIGLVLDYVMKALSRLESVFWGQIG